MPPPEQALFAMPAMRALLRAETAAVCARLPSRAGSYGLKLGMQGMLDSCPDVVAHWARLRRCNARWRGDLQASAEQPLPFADDAFAVVWLSQVTQFDDDAARLLREAVRVIAPGGLLAVTGVHPVSVWAPWVTWAMRGAGEDMQLRTPRYLGQVMVALGMQVAHVTRFGQVLPRTTGGAATISTRLGGGYMLLARKRQQAATPLRRADPLRGARLQGSLAPGAHRECA